MTSTLSSFGRTNPKTSGATADPKRTVGCLSGKCLTTGVTEGLASASKSHVTSRSDTPDPGWKELSALRSALLWYVKVDLRAWAPASVTLILVRCLVAVTAHDSSRITACV
jgi:hypothetical protein